MCNGNIQNCNSVHRRNKPLPLKMNSENCDKKYYIKRDLLAILTYYTKVIINLLNDVYEKLRKNYFYKLLLKTTQPAHLITIIAAVILAKILTPIEKTNEISPPSTFIKLTYLASFAAHFGIQIWMTFVSGLALYLCLPRHTFGDVQKVLFPKYFSINAIMSLTTLFTFLQCQDDINQNRVTTQIAVLVICFCIELTIRLYMTPRLLKLITEKNLMEIHAGVGKEIGQHDPGRLANCPHYVQLHSSFRKVHMTIAIGNMIAMACTTFHLYYLSDKISI